MDGWDRKPIEKCIERIQCPKKVPRRSFKSAGKFPIVSQELSLVNGYWDNEDEVLHIEKPLVIFGDHTTTLKYIDFDFVLGADGVKLLSPLGFLNAKYLYYYLLAHPVKHLGYSRHYRLLKKNEVAYPPLAEQQRIVSILDEVFAGLETATANTEKNLANARELFDSYLNKIIKQGGNAKNRPLSELTESISDGDHSPPPKADEGIPFITIGNIDKKSCCINFSNTFKVPASYYSSLKDQRKPRNGDILYTVTGSFGIPVLVPANIEFCFQRHIGLIRPKADISSTWLYYALMSPATFAQASKRATGTAQRTVSLNVLRSITVPFVNPRLQDWIASHLDAMKDLVLKEQCLLQQRTSALAELKQSILQKAFSGELTKNPDKALAEAGA